MMKKSTSKSKTAELEDDTFTTGHPSDAAKYEKTAETITIYIQREYSAGTYLAQAIRHGGAVSIGLPTKPKKNEKATDMVQLQPPKVVTLVCLLTVILIKNQQKTFKKFMF
jgi:hypothetical protein